jgi:hypothetical protein
MSSFSKEYLASELRIAKLRIACEGRQESIDNHTSEGKHFIAEMLGRQQAKDLAELAIARHEHLALIEKEAEEKANEHFETARYLWINSVSPYGDIDKYPDIESVARALEAEGSK